MTTRVKIAVFILTGCVIMTQGLYAEGNDPGIKLGRGLTNILASPGEYYVQTARIAADRDPMTRLLAGMAKGTWVMAQRIGVGVYDMLTFVVPYPADYRPVMQPPTVVEAIQEQYSKSKQNKA